VALLPRRPVGEAGLCLCGMERGKYR
jgi:hypothetical protein